MQKEQSMMNETVGMVSLFDYFFAIIDTAKKNKLSQQSYLRAYYFEVISNLEILKCINLDSLSTIPVNTPAIKGIIDNLETEVGLSLLFKEKPNHDLNKFFKCEGKIEYKKESDQDLEEEKDENILKAISFVVTKIVVLKKIANLNDNQIKKYKKLRIGVRIKNINERLRMIKEKMDGLPEIEDLIK